jgi:hypothetical protein
MRKDSFLALEKFVKSVRKKYGKKADKMRVELHMQYVVDGQEYVGPQEVTFLGVARYKEDKINELPAETVIVIK